MPEYMLLVRNKADRAIEGSEARTRFVYPR
jgi:hypothetical protein